MFWGAWPLHRRRWPKGAATAGNAIPVRPHWLLVAITVGIALVGVVLWGALIGSMLPFALRRAGFDPATSSVALVATLVDVTGLVIYFSTRAVVLRGTLL